MYLVTHNNLSGIWTNDTLIFEKLTQFYGIPKRMYIFLIHKPVEGNIPQFLTCTTWQI